MEVQSLEFVVLHAGGDVQKLSVDADSAHPMPPARKAPAGRWIRRGAEPFCVLHIDRMQGAGPYGLPEPAATISGCLERGSERRQERRPDGGPSAPWAPLPCACAGSSRRTDAACAGRSCALYACAAPCAAPPTVG